MVRLSNVGFKYDKYVFAHISYTFERGRLYILQGENGVGKTTLVRVILGLLTPSEGSVERGRPCVMSYLPDTNGIYGELTVMQNISFRLGLYGVNASRMRREIGGWLDDFGLSDVRNIRADQLSLGTRKKAAIAASCIVPSDLLVMDEPLNALDADARAVFCRRIEQISGSGRTVICISHVFEPCVGTRLVLTGDSLC